MFCKGKKEVTFFDSNMIVDTVTANSLEKADELFEFWADTKRA